MKFLHLGDLHIGKYLGDFDLIDDQKAIFSQIVELADEKQVDAVLLAGDIYDKNIPSEAAVRVFDQFIRAIVEKKIKVFIISGNHDSDERLNFGSSLFESNGVYICSKFNGTLYKQELEDEYGKVNVYLMPFIKASLVRHFYPDEVIENYDDAVRVVIENSNIDVSERNILVAHQFVSSKGHTLEIAGSEGITVQQAGYGEQVGLVEQIDIKNFEAFDYVALGHIHSAQSIVQENIRYAGSPLKYSKSEAFHEKTVPFVTVRDKDVDIELIKLIPKRDVHHIRGKLKDLLKRENVTGIQDYLYVTLTDDDFVEDAMGIFQSTYPNTVQITYDNEHTKAIENIDITNLEKDKSFQEMISDFYRFVYGTDMNEEELEIMMEIGKEVGVVDETY